MYYWNIFCLFKVFLIHIHHMLCEIWLKCAIQLLMFVKRFMFELLLYACSLRKWIYENITKNFNWINCTQTKFLLLYSFHVIKLIKSDTIFIKNLTSQNDDGVYMYQTNLNNSKINIVFQEIISILLNDN